MRVVRERRSNEADRRAQRRGILATVGHELRTPLTSIRGYIETLLDGDDLDAHTVRRFLETARREALRLGRLVEGMLEFSMLDVSPLPGEAYCDVAEQTRATVDAVMPLAREREVTVVATGVESARARIDPDACVHAVLNVVENAIKHGRYRGRVVVDCTIESSFVCVRVDDDGPGIAPEDRDAIFGTGIRGRTAARCGLGIGLAVVKAIVERAGGDVAVAAASSGGASFRLRFPLLL